MADTVTANYGWAKPTVGADQDTWGGTLNADLDAIDAQVFVNAGVTNFSTTATYTAGQIVAYQGALYVANGAVAAGPWNPAQWTSLMPPSAGGFVNRLRNGTFDVWQRGTSIATPANLAYTADGWQITWGAVAPASVARGSRIGRSAASLTINGAAGNTGAGVQQRIESMVAAPLAGQTVTVQATITNNTPASVTPTLATGFPTAADNFASVTGDLAVTSLQPIAAGATAKVAYTLNISLNAVNGYQVAFGFPAILAGQSASIADIDIRVTPGVAVGLNAAPPPPELRPIAAEYPFCQRYFWNLGNTPVFTAYASAAGQNLIPCIMKYPARMRASPSANYTTGSVVNCALTFGSPGIDQIYVQMNSSAAGICTGAYVGLSFSAEL